MKFKIGTNGTQIHTLFKSLAEAKEYLESYLNLKFNGKTQVWTGNGFKGNFWIDELAEEEIE